MIHIDCDTGAFDARLEAMVASEKISMHQFTYENRNKRIKVGAVPSDLRYDDTPKYTCNDLRTDPFLSNLTGDGLTGITTFHASSEWEEFHGFVASHG